MVVYIPPAAGAQRELWPRGRPRHWTRAEIEDELQFPPEEGPPLTRKSLKNAHWHWHWLYTGSQWCPVQPADAAVTPGCSNPTVTRSRLNYDFRLSNSSSGSISALRTSESELLVQPQPESESESVPQVTALALTGRLTWPHSLATLKVCCPEGPRGMAS